MLCLLSLCHKEAASGLKLAQWIYELGNVFGHDCLLSVNQTMARQKSHEPILELLRRAFRSVELYIQSPEDERPGPAGGLPHVYSANNAFIRVNKDIIQDNPAKPYFWMESDAIPLSSEWMNEIEREFFNVAVPQRKYFMGDHVAVAGTMEHMSGVAVYRQIDTQAPDYVLSQGHAWDVVAASQILPKAHFTKLIQHEWKPASFESLQDLSRLRSGAVVYHQCKDGSLIDRLRESRGGVTTARAPHPSEVAGLIPAPATSPDIAVLMAEIAALRSQLEANTKVKPVIVVPPVKVDEGKKQKRKGKKRNISPEVREAASQRMKAMLAKKRATTV